jgi:hypothetical protein
MLSNRRLFSLALFLACAVNSLAQQPRLASDAAPSAERLRAHVTYLASDQLDGRKTGTEGARTAARYIAEEFARLRLRPGGSHPQSLAPAPGVSRYMQEFPFVAGVMLGRNNSLLLTQASATPATLDLRLGEDWTPLGLSSNASIRNASVTFVGYGIKAAELNYDDYAGADVKGRIAFALAGTPDGDNPHGQFGRYEDVRWKAIAARERGAAALVVIAREENFRDDRLARLSYDNTAGGAGLPVVVISRQAAARILGLNGPVQLAELEKGFGKRSTASAATQTQGSAGATLPAGFELLRNTTLSLTTEVLPRSQPGTNVVGIIEGSDAQLKNETIVIGAHYDHLGRGGEGSLAVREGEVHHGADDNASGVAGLLELARLFSAQGMRPKRTLVLIAFGGEEEGLLGSNYYVNHPTVPLASTVAMINMDMIGRMKENRLMIGGVGTAAEWKDLIKAGQESSSAPASFASGKGKNIAVGDVSLEPFVLTLNEDGYGPSDHSSFYAKQVPVLFFFTGTHDDYHKPSDTADKINYQGEARIISLVWTLVRSIGAGAQRPTYKVAVASGERRSMSFRVTLGVVPNYAESGDGMKLDGVRDDSPASRAGLLAGDKIIRLAGHEVRNVYDYTAALGEMKAGEQYEVEILRAGATLKLKITPTARK